MTVLPRKIATSAVLAGALAILAAGCGSGGGGSSSDAGMPVGSGDIVSVSSVDGTSVLVDADGKTLYTASVEAGGHIKCVSPCTDFWLPMLATTNQAQQATSDLDEKFTVVDRPDGKMQLAFDGLPLYTFTQEGPDQLKGNGFSDDFDGAHFVWSAAGADSSVDSAPTTSGGSRYGY